MPISLDSVSIGANESFFVKVQGSSERAFYVVVSKSGRCFVAAPYNMNRKVFELTTSGMKEVSEEERDAALGL